MTAEEAKRTLRAMQTLLGSEPDGDPRADFRDRLKALWETAWPGRVWPGFGPAATVPVGEGRQLFGSPGWKFSARIEGEDILVRDTTATWFGGPNDPQDNGQTASGVDNTRLGVLGCALPVIAGHGSTAGSPIAFPASGMRPGIPWKTQVEVRAGGIVLTVPLIDNGPAKSAGHGIDLTPAAFQKFAEIRQGVIRAVTYRIIGAAKYAPKI